MSVCEEQPSLYTAKYEILESYFYLLDQFDNLIHKNLKEHLILNMNYYLKKSIYGF